jgi:hypothetical protein
MMMLATLLLEDAAVNMLLLPEYTSRSLQIAIKR